MLVQPQLLEEHETIQNYIATLFDSLPRIKNEDARDVGSLLTQNVEYGRKIIQLAERFTAKYRKDHFVDRRDVEEKIALIFRHLCPHSHCSSLDDMVTAILRRVEEGPGGQGQQSRSSYGQPNLASRANSINQLYNFNTKDSKVEFYRDEAEENQRLEIGDPIRAHKQLDRLKKSKLSVENLPLQPSEPDLNGQASRKRSMNKSKVSRKGKDKEEDANFTTKNVLQIKVFFEQEEQCLRKLFEKINKTLSQPPSLGPRLPIKISTQNSEYSKCVNEAEKETLKEFVQANIQNSKHNIHKLGELLDVLADYYEKRSKLESLAQGKFNTYVEEINKREEVFSFAVSKLMENIHLLRTAIHAEGEGEGAEEVIEKLEEISQGFYDLYPSHSILKDLKINTSQICLPSTSKELEKLGYKSEGVQVSLGRNEKLSQKEAADSKRNMLELFKTSARVNEMIEKFQRSMKYKKNVEPKEVDRLIESIRDSFPKKGAFSAVIATEATSYQEELKRIVEANERNEKELAEEYSKKTKKYQKQIQELEKTIEDIVEERRKQLEKAETSTRKISKKLQSEKEETKRISNQKASLQKNIREMSNDIGRLQREIKDQNDRYQQSQRMLASQNRDLQVELEKLGEENKRLNASSKEEVRKMEEEREIYQQKIIFLESHEEARNEELAQLKEELEDMIKENTVLKKQVEQLTELYEDKIKQLEELIDNIKELEDELKTSNLHGVELQESVRILEEKVGSLEREKGRLGKDLARLEDRVKEKESEADKYRQLGVLNESDIGILKQEMEKVKEAYIQSEQQLEELREYVQRLESEREFMLRENRNYRKEVEGYNEKWQANQLLHQKLQREVREYGDDAAIRKRELNTVSQELQQSKKQNARLKKEVSQLRECNQRVEGELRAARQENQKKAEGESLENGRRKLELEAAKVELRRKSEQLEKMKEGYEEKLEMLESKNRELSQFITQKQLLAKITNSHLSQ